MSHLLDGKDSLGGWASLNEKGHWMSGVNGREGLFR